MTLKELRAMLKITCFGPIFFHLEQQKITNFDYYRIKLINTPQKIYMFNFYNRNMKSLRIMITY